MLISPTFRYGLSSYKTSTVRHIDHELDDYIIIRSLSLSLSLSTMEIEVINIGLGLTTLN